MTDEHTTRAILTRNGKVMIEQPDGRFRQAEARTDWDHVSRLTEPEIEDAEQSDPDARLLDEKFLSNARVVVPRGHPRTLNRFRAQDPG
jgi:hypothetical protein